MKGQVKILKKGSNQRLHKNLTQNEIDCQCKSNYCHYTMITYDNLSAFKYTREEFDASVTIRSGFRCQYHNKKDSVGGVATSNHTLGDALDMTPTYFSKKELDRLEKIAKKYYAIVIRYPDFIHCDRRLFK